MAFTLQQINSILLILVFNVYMKIAYVVHFTYFLRFIFSESDFIKAIWLENKNSVDCRIEPSAPLVCPGLCHFVLGFVAVVSPARPITLKCCQICCCCDVSLMVDVGAGVMRRTWLVEHSTLVYDHVPRLYYWRQRFCLCNCKITNEEKKLSGNVVAMAT